MLKVSVIQPYLLKRQEPRLKRGKQVIESVSSSVNSLAQKLQQSMDVTKELEDNSHKISVVLDVIRGIAEQTNLLALNAAIEAAGAEKMDGICRSC